MITNPRYFLTVVLVVVTVSTLISCKHFSPNKNDAKFKEVERLSAGLPTYPSRSYGRIVIVTEDL
jgi:hypothetical protein